MRRVMVKELNNYINEEVKIQGWIYRIRKLKEITFMILRDRTGLVQCVIDNKTIDMGNIKLESVVSIIGEVKENNNILNPFEISTKNFEILNEVKEELPIEINKKQLEINLDTMLNNRILSLRHEKINSIFKIQNLIIQGFREFLTKEGFTEIFTPKIVAEGAEGGTEIFEVKYFENKAYLAQSPQFYKQMMVGAGYERVFEIAHVYRAEQHNTNRHLNEYISMDFEMGFIENEEDVMNMEENLLKHVLNKIEKEGKEYLEILNIVIPKIENTIPRIKFSEAIEILRKEYNKTDIDGDLDPEGEKLICKYAKEKLGCEFIFLTHYPRKKRPMYTMPCGENETHSFDLLFRGIEITTGGQRIHEYDMLIDNIKYKGLNPEKYHNYTSVFKYGMPRHGGLAIGLERITMQILKLENVREASLIPRDRTRLTP
ncbi:aspartate--tRNA(Asn) ligase [Clostridium sp. MSJ-11]|uniref:Aspartate--tRNA ligase n=1 Tax=Clostridium mobile TaxID=2841512 RepID=A0ABS6EJK4_9CLOT|nr:aspartate--tRNA(Asn) ligase [Clostridium mobile]MBU5485233.1 aspartate--tRNA(Asn) ligase [Clostridium mobile]